MIETSVSTSFDEPSSERLRDHYLPVECARCGMQLGAPVQVIERGVLTLSLPAGHVLTEENMQELKAHHGDYVFVRLADPRTEAQVAMDAAEAAKRVLEIFRGADLTEPHMASFFDQILRYRSL